MVLKPSIRFSSTVNPLPQTFKLLAKGFPSDFKALADYIHSKGMLFGVYTDRGTATCGGLAGAKDHEFQDARFYARNEIDYLKEDSCNAAKDHPTERLTSMQPCATI